MARLNCLCGGDGIFSVIYANHKTKQLRGSIKCCIICNKHDDLSMGQDRDEIVVLPEDAMVLRGRGYKDTNIRLVSI